MLLNARQIHRKDIGAKMILLAIEDITEQKMTGEKLLKSESDMRMLIAKNVDGLIIVDVDGILRFMNPAAESLFGYTAEKLMGKPMGLPLVSGEAEEMDISAKDGTQHSVEMRTASINWEEKEAFLVSLRDITRLKRIEEKLRFEEQRFRSFVEHSSDMIILVNMEGVILYVNPAIESILGFKPEERIGVKGIDTVHPDDMKALADVFNTLSKDTTSPVINGELRLRHKDGSWRMLEAVGSNLVNNNVVESIIINYRDITERKKAEEQIKHFATHDLLTDLPSLRLAKDRLAMAINLARRYKKSVAVMFIDLDGFKAVNDTFGHDISDYVLTQVAQRMLHCMRQTDTVARIGGDEFLIIATEINTPENAALIAENLIKQVSQPIIFNGQQTVVGASIGIALFPDHDKNMDQLITLADEAMYRVKNAGKNGFCFVNTTAN